MCNRQDRMGGINMTIEEKARLNLQYEKDFLGHDLSEDMVCRAYIAGAKEQKAIDEEVRLKKCDDMTEAEYEREVAFADWYHQNGKGTPTYSDAIEWTRKEVIEKACDILEYMTGGRLGKRFISEFKNKLKYGVLERH